MTADEPLWEDPPAYRKRPGARWVEDLVAQLRKHPGKWARVRRPNGDDQFLRNARAGLRKRGCEVRGQGIPNSNKVHMWARWPEE